jgi:ferredoxin-NADP reductase
MTALLLLGYICAGLAAQATVGIGAALWMRSRSVAAAQPAPVVAASALAWRGLRSFRVAHREFEDRAKTQCSFRLEPVDGLPLPPFTPGQYLTFALEVPDARAGAPSPLQTLIRCYSLSDVPAAAGYRITVKRAPACAATPGAPAVSASAHLLDQVREGQVLQVKAPSGKFVLEKEPGVPAVLLAGGIGLTPLLSMLRASLAGHPERLVHLYYGLRNGEEHAFKGTLEGLAQAHPNFHLTVVYSRPGPGDVLGRDYQAAGFIDVPLLRRTLPAGRHQYYLCGPPPMMAALLPALREWGVQQADLHHEAFGPASPVPSAVPQTLQALPIELRRSERTLSWTGEDQNLLDFAERHGVVVEAGCRTGSCGACETRLFSGEVRYAEKPDHEIAAGHCLLCVGTPAGALAVDA